MRKSKRNQTKRNQQKRKLRKRYTKKQGGTTKEQLPIFRKKYINYDDSVLAETTIATRLMNNPHPNIVHFYDVTNKYIDMEKLDMILDDLPDTEKRNKIIETMREVKTFLQKNGIMYIDWKWDNIGKSQKEGTYKLFDFDSSGLIDMNTGKWIIQPTISGNYIFAEKEKKTTPQEIDDWAFEYNIVLNTDFTEKYW